MNIKNIKVKLLTKKSKMPKLNRLGDAGYDVYSLEYCVLEPGKIKQFKLGIALEFSDDLVCLVQERSGMALKNGITTIGNVIDSNYRGEISAILINLGELPVIINIDDRIAQLLFLKNFNQSGNLIESTSLNETERGVVGFGSSGN